MFEIYIPCSHISTQLSKQHPVSTRQNAGWTSHSSFLALSGLEKGFTLDVITLALGGSQQPFSCVLSHFWHGAERRNKQTNNQVILVQACSWPVRRQYFTIGTGQATKTDEFSEKFQTAFDLPPPTHSLIFGKLYCNFLGIMSKKKPIKVQNLQHTFLNGKWPPFIRFGTLTRPTLSTITFTITLITIHCIVLAWL